MKSIIGLTGPLASGKQYVADQLIEKGYSYFSLSDEVRKEARRRGLPIEREILQNVGDSLRKEFGTDILAQRVGSSIDEARKEDTDKIIIDGLRNPGEIKWLKDNFDIFVVGVTADQEVRLKRFLRRARTSDPLTEDDFYKVEERDRGIGQEQFGQQVDACLELADLIIENNGDFKELDERLKELFITYGIENTRITKEGR